MDQPPAGITESYQRGLRDLPREHGFEPLELQGELPPELRGTLYLNGPGLFSLFGHPYRHWFDGDGAMTAIRFGGGEAHGAVRLVESRQLLHERRAGRALYTSGATLAPQWQRRLGLRHFKNAANTKPMLWNERLFALYEAGLPTELDPETLATVGETDLDGAVKGFFSAHFHGVPSRRALYNFSIKRGRQNMLHLYELPNGGALHCIGSLPMPKSWPWCTTSSRPKSTWCSSFRRCACASCRCCSEPRHRSTRSIGARKTAPRCWWCLSTLRIGPAASRSTRSSSTTS